MDMLVKLYTLPPLEPVLAHQREQGILVRRTLAPEKHHVLSWIKSHFDDNWVSETDAAFARLPVTCFIATLNNEMLGFACYDATAKGFFGPTGVGEAARGRGTGKALLLACLHDMRAQGYGYAIIGGVGPVAFYEKAVGAVVIPDSTPGIYQNTL
ncbi:MAG: GNAT family N-acetyltransferase [Chloroflexi bacterium]|nr:MAG: GNAT family N-acetyltransferase [Chloroflexota bacterium]